MAQNWASSPRKTRALRLIDLLTTPLAALDRLTRRASTADAPRRILVVECWQLGDAIMAVPFLRALRARFPDAHIALLCKASTRTLLEPSALVDEYVVADLPWTAFSGKYALSRYTDVGFRSLLTQLRRARFDVTIDARADVRANVLTWLTRAPMRVGFGGAGARLLTHRLPGPNDDTHKVEDWFAMLTPLGAAAPATEPRIVLDPAGVASVERWLRTHQITPATRLVAIHPSARLAVRRWPMERFAALARALQSRPDVQVVAFVDPDRYGHELGAIDGVVTAQPTLEELPALLASCDLFVGNDSGPAHIAGAVGTPTVTIFGPQVAAWYRPFGEAHRVVQLDDVPCRPCFDQCDRVEHICLTGIDAARVLAVVEERLDEISGSRPPRRAGVASPATTPHYLSRL